MQRRVLQSDDRSDDPTPHAPRRIELFTGATGRRRWPDEIKARIVLESLAPRAVVTDVTQRHGCRPQQIPTGGVWRGRAASPCRRLLRVCRRPHSCRSCWMPNPNRACLRHWRTRRRLPAWSAHPAGADAGDEVLRQLGAFLQHSIRSGDIACRYGGEELLLVLPDCDSSNAKTRLEHLCKEIREKSIPVSRQGAAERDAIGRPGAVERRPAIRGGPDHRGRRGAL